MPDDARADILSMTLKQLLLQRRLEVKLNALTLGFKFRLVREMLEFKQDTGVFQLVSAMKRCTLSIILLYALLKVCK